MSRPAAERPVNRLVSISAGDLLARSFPERRYVIDPWLRSGETALIWAASGVGKTMLSLSLAMAMATGGSAGTWKSDRPWKVLYVDGEMHQQDIRDRLVMLEETEAVAIGPHASLAGGLVFVNRQGQAPEATFYDLSTSDGQATLLDMCKQVKAEVLILDNFTTLSEGLEDENAATSLKKIQSFLLTTKQMGLTTILVHHSRKDGGAFRGSASIEVTFEVVLELQKPAIARVGGASFVPRFGKFRQRMDERLLPRAWSLTENGWEVSDEVVVGEDDPVVRCVKSLEFISQQEIVKHTGLSKGTVSKRIKKAIEMKLLKPDEAGECFASARRIRESPETDGLDQEDDLSDAESSPF
ncbi:AAA family ATPase [Kaistia sp. 32K]|uniref:AAA family ATPase n=1 Tax=Kaistia sp. 32K TaxID=2795690 RepID=UPI0019157057|nr:AAA family ATPase [Kaistia sp. 32K]